MTLAFKIPTEGIPDETKLPERVRKLQPRMRQIAACVYFSGGSTVLDVHQSIEDPPTIYAIRTMLGRLTRKGILNSRKSGQHMSALYTPAILTDQVKELAVEAFLARNFDGSAAAALEILLQMGSGSAQLPGRRGRRKKAGDGRPAGGKEA